MEKSGRFALLAALLDFVPGAAEELDVGANFVIRGAARGGSNDKAAGIRTAGFTDEAAKARAVIRGNDFPRNTGVMDGRHVDQEAAGQSDVAGDAGALFAKGFFSDLDDHVLAGLQHFGNELRTARWAGTASLIAAGVSWATGAGASFEPRATGDGAATAIRASASAIAATVASATAERALEA